MNHRLGILLLVVGCTASPLKVGIGGATVESNPPANYGQSMSFDGGSGSFGATVGDFNGDGSPDVLVVNFNSNTVQIFLGSSSGVLHPGTTVSTCTSPGGIASGDLNGDGAPDFVVACTGSFQSWVNNNNGTGTFTLKQTVTDSFTAGYTIALGALGTDTKLSAVVGDHNSAVNKVFIGNADGTFNTSATSVTGVGGNWSVLLYDINSDGYQDIISAGNANPPMGINFGSATDTSFGTLVSYNYPSGNAAGCLGAAVGDVNGDNVADIVIGGTRGIFAFLGTEQSNPNWTAGYVMQISGATNSTVTQSVEYQGLQIADTNGDGFADIISAPFNNTTTIGGALSIFPGLGNGGFGGAQTYVYSPFASYLNPAIGDLNRDGLPEIILPNFNGNGGTIPNATIVYSSAAASRTQSITTASHVTNVAVGTWDAGSAMWASPNFSCDLSSVSAQTPCQSAPLVGSNYVQSVAVSNGGTAQSLSIISGTNNNCDGGTPTTIAGAYFEPVNGTTSLTFNPPIKTTAGTALCCGLSGSTSYSCTIQGYVAP